MDPFADIVREALIAVAVLCFPILVAATLVGAVVAVLQAATQVQEQTLTLLPKMLVVAVAVACFGGFGMNVCGTLLRQAVELAPRLVRAA